MRFRLPGQAVLAGIETGNLFIIALRTPVAVDVELTGQDTSIEIDLSRGAINVGAVSPVVLTGQDSNVEIDLAQGTLNVQAAAPVVLTGQAIAVELDLSQGTLDVQEAGAVALEGQSIASEIDVSRGTLNVVGAGSVELSGQDTNIEIDVSQGALTAGIPLALSDYTVPSGYEAVVLALIQADRTSTDFLYRTDGTPAGTLSDGELVIDDLDVTISRIRDRDGDGSLPPAEPLRWRRHWGCTQHGGALRGRHLGHSNGWRFLLRRSERSDLW